MIETLLRVYHNEKDGKHRHHNIEVAKERQTTAFAASAAQLGQRRVDIKVNHTHLSESVARNQKSHPDTGPEWVHHAFGTEIDALVDIRLLNEGGGSRES